MWKPPLSYRYPPRVGKSKTKLVLVEQEYRRERCAPDTDTLFVRPYYSILCSSLSFSFLSFFLPIFPRTALFPPFVPSLFCFFLLSFFLSFSLRQKIDTRFSHSPILAALSSFLLPHSLSFSLPLSHSLSRSLRTTYHLNGRVESTFIIRTFITLSLCRTGTAISGRKS